METAIIYSDKYQSCIDACNRCYQACCECAVLCLNKPDAAELVDYIDLLINFAEICREAACSMSTGTKDVKEMYVLCATISAECKKCANMCRSVS